MSVDLSAMKMLCSQEFWRMAVLWTLSLLHSHFPILFAPPLSAFFPSVSRSSSATSCYPRCRFSHDRESKIERPICVITGATSGLGRAAARALAVEGYHVVLVGRSSQLLDQTIQEIKQKHGDAYLTAFQVDMASIHSIMNFESSLKQWLLDSNLHPSVQLLINNAGILATSIRVTSDGYDQMVETNYISAFVLTNLLLPLLKKSPVPSRIVIVTSFPHRSVYDVEEDRKFLLAANLWKISLCSHCDCCNGIRELHTNYLLLFLFQVSDVDVDRKTLTWLPTSGKYPCARIYEYSKLCLLFFTYELHRQLYAMDTSSNISVNSVDPGAVETSIMRELPRWLSWLAFTVLRCLSLLQSPEDGVNSILDAALAPPEVSGKYFFGGKGRTIRSSSLSYNPKLAKDLWSTSNTLFQESVLMKG